MAKSRKQKLAQARHKKEERKIFIIVGVVTAVLVVLLFSYFLSFS